MYSAEKEEEEDYSADWRDLRNRIITFFACWLGGFALAGGVSYLLPSAVPYLAILWIVSFIVTWSRWINYPCPRCWEPFFWPTPWFRNPFLRRCPHCELRISTPERPRRDTP